MHLLFFVLQNFLPLVLVLWPGIFSLDALVGLPPLAPRWPWLVAGVALAIPGLYLLAVTNKALRALGHGANAFRLTSTVVVDRIYALSRNPMSLGFYLWLTAIGLMTGSTTFTLRWCSPLCRRTSRSCWGSKPMNSRSGSGRRYGYTDAARRSCCRYRGADEWRCQRGREHCSLFRACALVAVCEPDC